jgi:uncharacterized membrane-anchored protein YitT (DUF2179 family)
MMGFDMDDEENVIRSVSDKKPWFRRSRRRQELVAIIITDQPKEVADQITINMRRGATIFSGEGAYTQEERSALLVAITSTEVLNLKKLVAKVSPKAFVMIMPAKNILGGGFVPLEEE